MPLESLKLADYVINTASGVVTTAMISPLVVSIIDVFEDGI